MEQQNEVREEGVRPVAGWSGFRSCLLFLFGVVLPVAALAVEWTTGICSETFLDPCPTFLLKGLIAAVPVCNLIVWLCCLNGWGLARRCVRVFCGFSLGVAAVYTLLLLPQAFFGLLFCCLFFWYFGFGFIGLLPAAPFLAFLSAVVLKRRLAKRTAVQGLPPVKGLVWGVGLAGLAFAIALAELSVPLLGLAWASSKEAEVSARGVRLLRVYPEGALWVTRAVGRGLYGPAVTGLLKAISGEDFDRIERDEVYYRVTGDDPSYLSWNGRRRHKLGWDVFQSGEKVGGVLEGLSLKGSSYSTTVDEAAGIGYAEWTMVFANAKEWRQAEARARIALPPGSVVSRVTLWVNGEEQEAAFGTRGQVRRAYEKVVARRRDPVLVNTCGPDQVQVQCFPVPAKGEMKMRLGVTMPLERTSDARAVRLPAPALLACNFDVPDGLLGLPAPSAVTLEKPLPAVAVYRDATFAPLGENAIVQRRATTSGWKPSRLAVVVDTSAGQEPVRDAVAAALAQLPKELPVDLWFTDDLPAKKPALSLAANEDKTRLAEAFRAVPCVGGRDNLQPLVAALTALAASAEPAAILWIHAPQPWTFQSADVLAAQLVSAQQVRLYACQATRGACNILDDLGATPRVYDVSARALEGDVAQAVQGVVATWGATGGELVRERVPAAEVPADAVAATKHLGRLWAAESVRQTYRVGDPVSLKAAQELVLPWNLVTPVSGAVVLETQAQYKENDLKQAKAEDVPTTQNAHSVPTTPEPSSVCAVLLMALVLLGVFFHVRRRRVRVA